MISDVVERFWGATVSFRVASPGHGCPLASVSEALAPKASRHLRLSSGVLCGIRNGPTVEWHSGRGIARPGVLAGTVPLCPRVMAHPLNAPLPDPPPPLPPNGVRGLAARGTGLGRAEAQRWVKRSRTRDSHPLTHGHALGGCERDATTLTLHNRRGPALHRGVWANLRTLRGQGTCAWGGAGAGVGPVGTVFYTRLRCATHARWRRRMGANQGCIRRGEGGV